MFVVFANILSLIISALFMLGYFGIIFGLISFLFIGLCYVAYSIVSKLFQFWDGFSNRSGNNLAQSLFLGRKNIAQLFLTGCAIVTMFLI